MSDEERSGTYQALPLVDRTTVTVILGPEDNIVDRILGEEVEEWEALACIDDEIAQLKQSNPELAEFVRSTVDAVYSACGSHIESEGIKLVLREVAYANALAMLRIVDMQLRLNQPR